MLEGIVLKVTHEYSIVKTKTEYLKIRTKPSMEPGQRIYFSKEDILYHPAAKKKSVPALIRYGVAAALAGFILATPLFSQKNAYGTKLLVEVNPSILLNINKDGLIAKAVAYNKDATLLPLENYLNLPVPDAIEEILGDAEAKGFLNLEDEEEDFVVLTEILTSGERLSEEIYTQLEERSLLGDLLSESSLVFTTASEQQLKTVKNEGKALGLMRLREEFNLEPHEKLGDFFKDPVRREAYKEQKRLLKRSTLEEDEDLLEELIEEDDVNTDFKAQLELFKSSINDVKEARKAYQGARKSGDPETIEKTLHALREAEEKRTQLEELKDKLEKAKAEEEHNSSTEKPGNNGTTPEKPNTTENNGNTPEKPVTPGNNGLTPEKPEKPDSNSKNDNKGNTSETPSTSEKNPEKNPNSTNNQGIPNENNKNKVPGNPSTENNGKKPAKDAPGQNK